MSAAQPPINSAGNAAFTHRLKCWAENFDAIVAGTKRAEVRAEEDRKFKSGDLLELLRTDRAGVPTMPETRITIEVIHVERYAGPLSIVGIEPATEAEAGKPSRPVAVLSLAPKIYRRIEGRA